MGPEGLRCCVQQQELIIDFYRQFCPMSHFDHVSTTLTTYFSDSEDDSLFQVKKSHQTHVDALRVPLNKRLLPRGSSWSRLEKQQYLCFLKRHFDLLDRPLSERRNLKIYWLMATFISTKNYAQCRIRHSKLLQEWGSVERVIGACEGELRRVEKMQQFGLKVEVEEEATQEYLPQEDSLWSVLEASKSIYCPNQLTFPTASFF